jgi:hypothetical protein
MTKTTTLVLDICTPEGKTWCALITALGGRYGFQRDFVNAVQRRTSRSGMTGAATYELEDGPYATCEGRRRLGRRYWIIRDGAATKVDSAKLAFAAFAVDAS